MISISLRVLPLFVDSSSCSCSQLFLWSWRPALFTNTDAVSSLSVSWGHRLHTSQVSDKIGVAVQLQGLGACGWGSPYRCAWVARSPGWVPATFKLTILGLIVYRVENQPCVKSSRRWVILKWAAFKWFLRDSVIAGTAVLHCFIQWAAVLPHYQPTNQGHVNPGL